MGDNIKQRELIKYVAAIKIRQFTNVKINAFLAEIFPAGISRMAVRGLMASISRSK